MIFHTHSGSALHSRTEFRSRSRFWLGVVLSVLAAALFLGGTGCGSRGDLAGPLAINSFVATPSTIAAGQSTTLSWSVTVAAASLSISNGSSSSPASGLTALTGSSVSVTPAATTTYTLTATDGQGNTTTATATVTVVPVASIGSFTASPAIISNNGSSTLSWSVSNATSVSIECITSGCQFQNSPENTYVPVIGTSVNVNPSSTTTYQLSATTAANTSVTAQVTVTVVLAPIIASFTASPASISAGQSSVLSWSVSGASSISINNGVGTVTGTSIQVSPTQTTTYTLTAIATDSTGTFQVPATAQATVAVSAFPPPSITSFNASPSSVGPNGDVSLTPVFTPVNSQTTATIQQCVGTESACSGSNAVFQLVGPASSGEVISVNPASSTTYLLTVTNASGAPATATVRVLAGDIMVFAGAPTAAGYQDGSGEAARFNQPNGIAADSAGNLYVADTGNDLIRKITPTGQVTTFAGYATLGLNGIQGVPGSLDGPAQCTPGVACAEFNGPEGIAVDSSDNVYVADSGNNTIRLISGGQVTTIAGSAGNAGYVNGPALSALFYSPQSLAIDPTGNLYIVDSFNCAIRELTGFGTSAASVSTFAGPSGPGECGYANGGFNAMGLSVARFSNPTSLALDAQNNLYVADENNELIRLVTPAGVVSTVAGQPGVAGGANGTGSTASFRQPTGVAVDSAGNIYVADSNNYTIREISPSPDGTSVNVTTIAGQTGTPNAQIPEAPLPGQLASPLQIALDPTSGNQFVTMGDQAIISLPY